MYKICMGCRLTSVLSPNLGPTSNEDLRFIENMFRGRNFDGFLGWFCASSSLCRRPIYTSYLAELEGLGFRVLGLGLIAALAVDELTSVGQEKSRKKTENLRSQSLMLTLH